MNNMKIFFYTCLIALFFISSHVFSQQADTIATQDFFSMSLEELMNVKIVSATKIPEEVSKSPATMFVISEEDIKSRGYHSLEELLEEIPGIEVQRNVTGDNKYLFSINGISGFNKLIILKDGIQINSVTGSFHAIGPSYSLQNAKQVEIILGPVSAIYGADAFAGVVNIITKRGEKTSELNARASYGMFNSIDFALDKNLVFDEIVFDFAARYYSSDGPFFPDIYEDEYSWYSNNYINNGNMMMFGDTVQIPIEEFAMPTKSYLMAININIKNFNFGYSHNFESQSSSLGNPPDTYIYSQDALYQNTIETAYADHLYKSKNGKWNLHSTASFQQFRIIPKSNYINQYNGYNKGYKYAINKTFTFEEQLHLLLSKNTSLILGGTYESNSVLPKTSDLPWQYDENLPADIVGVHYVGTDVTDMNGNDLTIYQNFYQIYYENVGAYANLSGNIFPSLKYNIGLRYDYNTRYKENISPRLGLIFSPEKNITMKLLATRSFLSPSPFEMYQHYGSFYPATDNDGNITGLASNFWRLPNPDLEPEYINSLEYDFSYLFSENNFFRFLSFYRFISNLITTEGTPDYPFHGVNVDWVEKPVNEGKSIVYGVSLILQGNRLISNSSNINYHIFYTYTDGNISDEPLIYSAKHTIKGGLDYKINEKANIYLSAIYRSASHHRRSTNEIPITNDPFFVIDLYGSYNLLQDENFGLDLFVKVNNLLNAKYYHAGWEDFTQVPQNPITVSIGFETQFK